MQKNDDPGFVLCAYHLLLRGSTPKTSPGNPGAMVQFWYFFFSRRGWELFSFGNDFAGPRGNSHGICSRFGQRNIALDQSFLSF